MKKMTLEKDGTKLWEMKWKPASSRRLLSLLFCWMKFWTVSLSTFNTSRISFKHVRFLQLEFSCLAFCFFPLSFLLFAFLIFFPAFDFFPFFVLLFFFPLFDFLFFPAFFSFPVFCFLLPFCFFICSNLFEGASPMTSLSWNLPVFISSLSSLGNPEQHSSARVRINTSLTFHSDDYNRRHQ